MKICVLSINLPGPITRQDDRLAHFSSSTDLDGLKRNMSRGNSLSDELDLSSVLGDTRAHLYSPVWG